MNNTGLFDLSRLADDGSLILMPWAQEAYGVRTSDEFVDYLEASMEAMDDEHERLMAELEFDD